jgi:NhaP-type Na+/H+ or K+/H+ antiporter
VKWDLAIVAVSVLVIASISGRLTASPVTPAMAFVAVGLLVGPLVLGEVDVASTGATVRTLAEATLAVVLFADASRVRLRRLRREYSVPLRLLGIGLPLTIILGSLLAKALFMQLTWAEALVLGVTLAPTDAALGQSVVTEPALPSRIRQGLNVESGLKTGSAFPSSWWPWPWPTSRDTLQAALTRSGSWPRRSDTGLSAVWERVSSRARCCHLPGGGA